MSCHSHLFKDFSISPSVTVSSSLRSATHVTQMTLQQSHNVILCASLLCSLLNQPEGDVACILIDFMGGKINDYISF
jgi:hypothetical protein